MQVPLNFLVYIHVYSCNIDMMAHIQVFVFARNVTGFIFGICKNPKQFIISYKEAIWKLYVKIYVIKYIRTWALT